MSRIKPKRVKPNIGDITTMLHIETVANCINKLAGEISLLPNRTYTVIFDYPFDSSGFLKINTGKKGVNALSLLIRICKAYQRFYNEEDKADDDDKPYGIWGHDIGDLHLEGVRINHSTRKITLSVGS